MLAFSSRCTSRAVSVPRFFAHDVRAQRQRQAGSVLPPFAQIDDQLQLLFAVRQLSFVNDQPRVDRLAVVFARRRPRE